MDMSVTEVMDLADVAGISQDTLKQLMKDLREAFKQWVGINKRVGWFS